MEENQNPENQEINEQVDSSIDEVMVEDEKIEEVIFRHPQQILTNKQLQNLFKKQAKVDQLKSVSENPDEVEDLTETEKGAIKLFLLRARHHNSKPKALSTKQRKALKKKRRTAKISRKANR
jgi:hypothetical protein